LLSSERVRFLRISRSRRMASLIARGVSSSSKIDAVEPIDVAIARSRLTPLNQRMVAKESVMPRAPQSCVEMRPACGGLSTIGPENDGMGRPFSELVTVRDAAANDALVVAPGSSEAKRRSLATAVLRNWQVAS
jgi:hypothetical protein